MGEQDMKADGDTPNPENEIAASMEATQRNDDLEVTKKSEDHSERNVKTIMPNTLPKPKIGRKMLQGLLKDSMSNLIQQPKSEPTEENKKKIQIDEDIRALRNEQLLSVSKGEIERIYELKNYAYLRAEEMKNLRLNLRGKSRANEEDTST